MSGVQLAHAPMVAVFRVRRRAEAVDKGQGFRDALGPSGRRGDIRVICRRARRLRLHRGRRRAARGIQFAAIATPADPLPQTRMPAPMGPTRRLRLLRSPGRDSRPLLGTKGLGSRTSAQRRLGPRGRFFERKPARVSAEIGGRGDLMLGGWPRDVRAPACWRPRRSALTLEASRPALVFPTFPICLNQRLAPTATVEDGGRVSRVSAERASIFRRSIEERPESPDAPWATMVRRSPTGLPRASQVHPRAVGTLMGRATAD